jgi:ABC-type transport system involved in multi-copper enzyme maturation permease subunit
MEPVSSSLAAVFKFYGAAIVVALAIIFVSIVVLMMRVPRSPQEFIVGIICTLVSSLTGAAFIIVKFSLHQWLTGFWELIAIGGLFFVCGIPGWAVVRWTFNFIDQREGKTLIEIIQEFKEEWQKK